MTGPHKIGLGDLNRMDLAPFVAVLGGIFEHSPWIPAAAWPFRPFVSAAALHARMVGIVLAAPAETQRSLLEAHPQLGGRAAQEKRLTEASAGEQAGAGFDRLDADEAERLAALNAAYHARFGFPFIIAVRGQRDRAAIIRALEARFANGADQEIQTALAEVAKIAWFRLSDLIEDAEAA